MSAKDTVRTFLESIERGDVAAAMNLVADNAQIVGPAPTPLDKRQFGALLTTMKKGFPDWSFHASDFRERGDKVIVQMQITATNTGDFTPPLPGMSTIHATGRSIALPQQTDEFTVRNGKLTAIRVTQGPREGVTTAILSQLGVSMPTQPAATERASAPSMP